MYVIQNMPISYSDWNEKAKYTLGGKNMELFGYTNVPTAKNLASLPCVAPDVQNGKQIIAAHFAWWKFDICMLIKQTALLICVQSGAKWGRAIDTENPRAE